MALVLRRGGPQDARFLRDMLRHALYWRDRVPGSLTSRYVRGWGRPEDTAVIALEGGFAVGAAWYRLFTAAEPGYGFVDEETPELAIAVVPSRRGRGIGDALLKELYKRAKEDGYKAVSLAAERDNAALVSYYEQKHGFERVHEDGGDSVTMRRAL